MFPTVGHCTTSPSVSAIVGLGHFSMVLFTLSFVHDCLYGIHAVFSVSSLGFPLDIIFNFIVEAYN